MAQISPTSIKQGDDYRSLLAVLPADEVLGVTSVDIILRGVDIGFVLPTVPVAGKPGVFEHIWQPGETSVIGRYQAEVRGTWPGDRVQTWPPRGFFSFRITADLDLDDLPVVTLPTELSYPVRSSGVPGINTLLVWDGAGWVPSPVPKGDIGLTGPHGVSGVEGLQGEQGLIGQTGPQGAVGSLGPQGLQGVQGLKGDTGDTGVQGIQGTQGPQGPDGTGTMGAQGPEGPQGAPGVDGAAGAQGTAGEAGAQGPVGDTGDTGAVGAIGPAGVQGAQGLQGVIGPEGAVGAAWGVDKGAWAGTTAYVISDTVTDSGGSYKAKAAVPAGMLNTVNNANGVPRVPDGFIAPGASASETILASKATEALPGFGTNTTSFRGYVYQFNVAVAGSFSIPAAMSGGGSAVYHQIVNSAGALVGGTQVTGNAAIPTTALAVGRYYYVIGSDSTTTNFPFSTTPSPAANMGTIGTRPALDAANWSVIAAAGAIGPKGLNALGAWVSSGIYSVDDVVTNSGETFRARIATPVVPPLLTNYVGPSGTATPKDALRDSARYTATVISSDSDVQYGGSYRAHFLQINVAAAGNIRLQQTAAAAAVGGDRALQVRNPAGSYIGGFAAGSSAVQTLALPSAGRYYLHLTNSFAPWTYDFTILAGGAIYNTPTARPLPSADPVAFELLAAKGAAGAAGAAGSGGGSNIFSDDFSTDTLPTRYENATGVSVANGVLKVAAADTIQEPRAKTSVFSSAGGMVCQAKFTPDGILTGTARLGIILKYVDANNYVYAQYRSDIGVTQINIREGGVDTLTQGGTSIPGLAINQPRWVRGILIGGVVQVGVWDADPAVQTNAPLAEQSIGATLTSRPISPLRFGQVGLRLTFPSVGWSIDDFSVKPMTG